MYGRLGVSRAFGDFDFKSDSGELVSCTPDIRQVFLSSADDEFLIIACDGFFEAYNNQEAVDLIRDKLRKMPLTEQDP